MGSDQLRVVHVCSAREAIYGAVQSLLTLAEAQRSAGTAVEFITFKGKQFGGQVRELGYTAHEVKVKGKIAPRAILEMRRVIQENRYDVVHTHLSTSSVNGALAARLARVPSVATVHGMSGKMSFAAATHLIAVSQGVRTHLMCQGVPGTKISVVYNGLDRSFQVGSRPEARRALGYTDEQIIVGTVSRITAMKGIEDGVRAFAEVSARYPQLHYLLVGDGDGQAACEALAKDLGVSDRVHFAGYQTDVAKYLAAMDIFLFPTLKEAMGIALVEAMASGLPCIASSVGGVPEVVTPHVGVLVPPKCPSRMADALEDLIQDEAKRDDMSHAAVIRANTIFGTATMETSTDEVYRKLIGCGARPDPQKSPVKAQSIR